MRYGENPHQKGTFYGTFDSLFDQLHGKEISYNNLLDIEAAVYLIDDFTETTFAILKHNNACGIASRPDLTDAWKDALAGDPVSAYGGILITNGEVDVKTAAEIDTLFFEVIIAPAYDIKALGPIEEKKEPDHPSAKTSEASRSSVPEPAEWRDRTGPGYENRIA